MNDRRRSLAIVYDVAYPFAEGGGGRRLYEIARRLVEDGWSVDWYCLKTWDGEPTQVKDGIRYFGLNGYNTLYRADGARSRRAALSFGRSVLFANTRFAAYDVVWCGQWPYFHILALCVRLVPWRTRLVVDWWEVWGTGWLEHGLSGVVGWALEIVLANICSRSGHIVAISSLGYNQLAKLGARKTNIELIPNGANINSIIEILPEEGASDVTYFGRLKSHKNVDHLIEAISKLQKRGTVIQADIIGDGPERAALELLAQELGVANQIIFHGRVDDRRLFSLLKRNQVFVHPSTKEGGGSITLFEANACGLPVVCYRHELGVDPEFVQVKKTGLLVDPVSSDALADGIVEMIGLTKTASLREACITFARRYDWSAIALKYLIYFAQLVEQKKFSAAEPPVQSQSGKLAKRG